jgi:hypothetical protein
MTTTAQCCETCGAGGQVFGYHQDDGWRWFCQEHMLRKNSADKRGFVPEPVDPPLEPGDADITMPHREVGQPRRSIDETVDWIKRRYMYLNEEIEKFKTKIQKKREEVKAIRLQIALELLDLKRRIEDGEAGDEAALDWWDWYSDNFWLSRSEAEKLLAIAGSSDPPEAMERMREQTRLRNIAYRERLQTAYREHPQEIASQEVPMTQSTELAQPPRKIKAPPKRYPNSPDDEQLVAEVMAIFKRMSWNARVLLSQAIKEQYQRWQRGEE